MVVRLRWDPPWYFLGVLPKLLSNFLKPGVICCTNVSTLIVLCAVWVATCQYIVQFVQGPNEAKRSEATGFRSFLKVCGLVGPSEAKQSEGS